jgi:dihydroxyacetone kinase-like predicted kinase
LEFYQRYVEFLEVKIENMSLQHNNKIVKQTPKKLFGIVSVCSGEGIQQMFLDRGVDVVIDGGQTMNPSTEDFLQAFEKINAETIFVFPNNPNIILTAKLAASMYNTSSIQIIESRSLGEGYSALSMFDSSIEDVSIQKENFYLAMEGVKTCCISQCEKDTEDVNIGDYIGFIDKEIISTGKSRLDVTIESINKIDLSNRDICIIIFGKNVDIRESKAISNHISNIYPKAEIYLIDGKQDIYDYIFIIE